MKRETKKGLVITIILILVFFIILIFALKFSQPADKAEDPRIGQIEKLYSKSGELSSAKDYYSSNALLDSIEKIYLRYPDYRNSYEMGTIRINRAVNWLSLAFSEKDEIEMFRMLDSSKQNAKKSIKIFENWLEEYAELSRNEIIVKIKDYYSPSDSIFDGCNLVELINKRTEQIILAQTESKTKVSLAYTNLATIYYKEGDKSNAIESNKKALQWWPKNTAASENLKMLSGKGK